MNTPRFCNSVFPFFLSLSLVACSTTTTLQSTTTSHGATATEIIYEMVLSNLEMIRQDADALPWHTKLTQGSITVADSATPNFTYAWPTIAKSLGLSATRQWQVSWTVVPVLDKQTLVDLRERYKSEAESNTFATSYEEGATPPADGPYGRFGGRYIWVRKGGMGNFTILVTDILSKTPVAPVERAIQLPGSQMLR